MRLLQLAWRNLLRQKVKTLTTLLAVILALAGLVVFEGFVTQLMEAFRDSTILSGIGHVQIASSAHYWKDGEFSPYAYPLPDAQMLEKRIRQDPRVLDVFPSTGFTAIAGFGNKSTTILVKGYPDGRMNFSLPHGVVKAADVSRLDPDRFNLGTLIAGQNPRPQDRGGLYLGQTTARILKARLGDKVTLMILLPEGGVNGRDFVVRGIYDSAGNDKYFAYTDYATAVDFTMAKPPLLHVLLKHRKDTSAFANDMKVALPGLHLRTWKQLATFYVQVNSMFAGFLAVIQTIILVVTLFLLANSLARTVLERQREWGTLRALGTPAGGIVGIILLEGGLLGTAGGILGLVAGFVAAGIINLLGGLPFQNGPTLLSVSVSPNLLTVVGVLIPLVVTGVLAALGPAFRAARQEPADSLRELA